MQNLRPKTLALFRKSQVEDVYWITIRQTLVFLLSMHDPPTGLVPIELQRVEITLAHLHRTFKFVIRFARPFCVHPSFITWSQSVPINLGVASSPLTVPSSNQLKDAEKRKLRPRLSPVTAHYFFFSHVFFIAATLYVGVVVISFHRRKGTHAIGQGCREIQTLRAWL